MGNWPTENRENAAWPALYAERERGFAEAEVGVAVLTAFSLGCAAH